jgi:alkanesulfonate monooxygenase SsuD/methylene tetrahydromethanopterin reductase-like flavin-dependent oxidoreductase (luciferase family)
VQEGQKVKAIPGAGLDIPIWILGSSTYSAHLGRGDRPPYAFASHFAPGELLESLEIYRREFRPSATLAAPYVMVGVPAFAAESDERAEFLATSMYQRSLGIMRGATHRRCSRRWPDMNAIWTERGARVAERMARDVRWAARSRSALDSRDRRRRRPTSSSSRSAPTPSRSPALVRDVALAAGLPRDR